MTLSHDNKTSVTFPAVASTTIENYSDLINFVFKAEIIKSTECSSLKAYILLNHISSPQTKIILSEVKFKQYLGFHIEILKECLKLNQ